MISLDQLTPHHLETEIISGGSHQYHHTHHHTSHHHTKHYRKHKTHWGKEIVLFVAVMTISACIGIVFTNAHLFQAAIVEDLLGWKKVGPTVTLETESNIVNDPQITIVESLSDDHYYADTNDHLKQQLASNSLVFNTLPPDDRIIVSEFGIDAPIVNITYYTDEKLEQGDFKEELERGVIRYPNTGSPEGGNMLLFGHTSDYWWNHNDFGQVFRNIPKFENGQEVTVIRRNHKYTYRIIDQKIVAPKDVSKVYAQYHDNEKRYLTLVGCYPIGTAKDRVMVIGELISQEAIEDHNPNEVVQLAKNP